MKKLSSTELFDHLELFNHLQKVIIDKIGKEKAYLLEENLDFQFHELKEILEDMTDSINKSLKNKST